MFFPVGLCSSATKQPKRMTLERVRLLFLLLMTKQTQSERDSLMIIAVCWSDATNINKYIKPNCLSGGKCLDERHYLCLQL